MVSGAVRMALAMQSPSSSACGAGSDNTVRKPRNTRRVVRFRSVFFGMGVWNFSDFDGVFIPALDERKSPVCVTKGKKK